MTYHIPGKTFLLGEYAALVGGSVLGLATRPGFEVSFDIATNKSLQQFKSVFTLGSPAAAAHAANPKLQINFKDLVKVGGFGKSTAEYLSVILPTLNHTNDFKAIRNEYKKTARAAGSEVSGIDLAIQLYGRVMHFDATTQSCTSYPWKYPNLEFMLISTGVKVKTHEHLQQLDMSKLKNFPAVSDRLIQQCLSGDENDLVKAVNEWHLFLDANKLVHEHAANLHTALMSTKEILAAKPCGALGADVILILCDAEKASHVKKVILNMNLAIVAESKDLCSGVLTQINNEKSVGPHVG